MPKSEFVYLSNTLLYSLQFGFECLKDPLCILFVIYIWVTVFTAGLSYPKKHIRNFFILFPLMFIFVMLFLIDEGSFMKMLIYGIAFVPIYIPFYWLTILCLFLLSLAGILTQKKKYLLCTTISFVLWGLMFFWINVSLDLLYFIVELF